MSDKIVKRPRKNPEPSGDLDLLTAPQIKKLFGLSRTTVWRWQNEGLLPGPTYQIGSTRYWSRAELMRWLEARRVTPAPEPPVEPATKPTRTRATKVDRGGMSASEAKKRGVFPVGNLWKRSSLSLA
jgi:predicted DNA-binding transcriptional regulator AlpA